MEEVYTWWMERDEPYPLRSVLGADYGEGGEQRQPCLFCDGARCARCRETGLCAYARTLDEWGHAVARNRMDLEEAERDAIVLRRALRGYFEVYGVGPSVDYRVVGVELSLCAQVHHPLTGRPYKPRMYLLRTEQGYRMPLPGEWAEGKPAAGVTVSWPWYQVGRLDAVLQHRRTGALWVVEFKSSKDPLGYIRGVSVDPQTTGYTDLLERSIDAGLLPFSGPVVGVLFDVASSQLQSAPARLKDQKLSKKAPEREQGLEWKVPRLSTAKNKTTPSWLYRDAIAVATPTPDGQHVPLEPYLDHIRWCRQTWDQRLYQRESFALGASDLGRYRDESYGLSARIARQWRQVARAGSAEEINLEFPRVPVCRMGRGGCSYFGPCGSNTDPTEEKFSIGKGQTWVFTTPDDLPGSPDIPGSDSPSASPSLTTLTNEEAGF